MNMAMNLLNGLAEVAQQIDLVAASRAALMTNSVIMMAVFGAWAQFLRTRNATT